MQAPVAELAWTQYAGFGVLLGGIFLSAMAIWSWTRVCAGHLAALREIAARDQHQRDDQAEREFARRGEKLRASDTEIIADALATQHARRREEQGRSDQQAASDELRDRVAQQPSPHMTPELEARFARWCKEQDAAENRKIRAQHDAVREMRWDEGEQALTSRPEAPAPQPVPPDPETSAAAGQPSRCEDRACIWFGKFDHERHLLPGREGS